MAKTRLAVWRENSPFLPNGTPSVGTRVVADGRPDRWTPIWGPQRLVKVRADLLLLVVLLGHPIPSNVLLCSTHGVPTHRVPLAPWDHALDVLLNGV